MPEGGPSKPRGRAFAEDLLTAGSWGESIIDCPKDSTSVVLYDESGLSVQDRCKDNKPLHILTDSNYAPKTMVYSLDNDIEIARFMDGKWCRLDD